MARTTKSQATATLPDVRGNSVPTAQRSLASFTNLTWQDSDGNRYETPPASYFVLSNPANGRTPEAPADKIGRAIPTDTAVTLTIAAAPVPKTPGKPGKLEC